MQHVGNNIAVFRVSSSCTQERHARGMLQGSALRTERIWVPTCGTHGGSRFWDHLLGTSFADEQKLWDAQCARLAMCVASPASVRWTPLPRTVPPSMSEVCAQGHDAGMLRTMEFLLGTLPGDNSEIEMARHIMSLPFRMGGGLRSAQRLAPATNWASWADALPMLQQRLTDLGSSIVRVGRHSNEASDHNAPQSLKLVSGNVAGSAVRLPLPNAMCCKPSPLEVAFRSMCQFGPMRVTHFAGVHSEATPLSHHHPRTFAAPIVDHGRQV